MRDAPTPSTSMAFTDIDLEKAADSAIAFAGSGGRLATLPDIIDARLASSEDRIAWDADITTSSVEYVGRSKNGTPLAVVAHGVGPLADPECLSIAHLVAEGLSRNAMISQEEFNTLLDGGYGDVEVYDLNDAIRRRDFHLQQPMTMAEAMNDVMVRARLGRRCEEFLKLHHKRSRDWREDRDIFGSDEKCIIQMRDPRSYSYFLLEGTESGAAAHPLRISRAEGNRHCHFGDRGSPDHTCLITKIGCYPWQGTATLVGAKTGPVQGLIHPGIDSVRAWFRRHYPLLYRRNARRPTRLPTCALVNIDGLWFTQHPREGTGIDKCSPQYRVTNVAPIKRGIEITLPYRGNVHQLVYNQEEIIDELPVWANAYHLVGEPNPRWLREEDSPSHVTVRVDAYQVRTETRWYIPTMEEVRSDFAKVLNFPAALPSHP